MSRGVMRWSNDSIGRCKSTRTTDGASSRAKWATGSRRRPVERKQLNPNRRSIVVTLNCTWMLWTAKTVWTGEKKSFFWLTCYSPFVIHPHFLLNLLIPSFYPFVSLFSLLSYNSYLCLSYCLFWKRCMYAWISRTGLQAGKQGIAKSIERIDTTSIHHHSFTVG